MNWLRELTRRIRMLVNRRQFDVDLEEEMRLHLELRQQDQIESGMSADDAQAAARRRFGNVTSLRERSNMAWGWEWLEHLTQDVRFGFRILSKNLGVTIVIVLTLALSVGANTAISRAVFCRRRCSFAFMTSFMSAAGRISKMLPYVRAGCWPMSCTA
jgi:hypothetical protein